MRFPFRSAAMFAALLALAASAFAAPTLVRVRMAIDEDPIVVRLAQSLGYLRDEGLEIMPVDLEKLMGEDYLLQQPLVDGRIDAAYHWFNHTVFGARHGLPVKALMVFNDTPGMTVMVANRVNGEIHGAADFRGRRVAQGAGYGTKAVITGYLAQRAGLPRDAYTPVAAQSEGRLAAVLAGLKNANVDVMTFQEPVTSALEHSGMVSTLYDLNTEQGTRAALGAPFPAQSLLVAPRFTEQHPNVAQHLVNAFVRTMRFINRHDADQIIAALPPAFFEGKDRTAAIAYVRATLPSYSRDDFCVPPAGVRLVIAAMRSSRFDHSVEGRWRAGGDDSKVVAEALYDNRLVEKAMQRIR